MNQQTTQKTLDSRQDNLRIKILLNKLKERLVNFNVMDRLGYLVGRVSDVMLDSSRQLNLVIVDADTPDGSSEFLLRSSYIKHVDSPTKSVFIELSKPEIHRLPSYVMPEMGIMQHPESLDLAIGTPGVVDENISPENTIVTPAAEMIAPAETVEQAPSIPKSQITEEEIIRLLEERLIVDINKRKVGEVIVRKQVETRMVQVPVHYEKLIVEQVSPERKQLAEIDLSEGEISGLELVDNAISQVQSNQNQFGGTTVSAEFSSPKTAGLLLDAIAMKRNHGCQKVRIEIIVENEEQQKTYQEWFNRCSIR